MIEVYPAAALRVWLLPYTGYKGTKGSPTRRVIAGALEAQVPGLAGIADRCVASDNLLDAVIAALIGRAFDLGLVQEPPPDAATAAAQEGWIWLPTTTPDRLMTMRQ